MSVKFLLLIQIMLTLHIAFRGAQANVLKVKVNRGGLQKILIATELKYNWFEAEAECARRDMLLMTLDTAQKSKLVNEILSENIREWSRIWIGGQDMAREGNFVWTATGEPFGYTNWRHNMPDNYRNNEDCVHMGRDLKWNDARCSLKLGFLCES